MEVCAGRTPARGGTYICGYLFLWHIFPIYWKARLGPLSKCIVLWSNKSIVWVTLLPSHRWLFWLSTSINSFDKYSSELALVFRQIKMLLPTRKHIHMHFSSIHFKNSFLQYFCSALTPYVLVSFLFSSTWVWLFCFNDHCSCLSFNWDRISFFRVSDTMLHFGSRKKNNADNTPSL